MKVQMEGLPDGLGAAGLVLIAPAPEKLHQIWQMLDNGAASADLIPHLLPAELWGEASLYIWGGREKGGIIPPKLSVSGPGPQEART